MAWNGSDLKGTAQVEPQPKTAKPSLARGIVAGLAVVLIAVGAAWWILGTGKPQPVAEPDEEARPARTISSVKPTTPKVKPAGQPEKTVAEKALEAPKKEEPKIDLEKLETVKIEDGLVVSEAPTNMPRHMRNPYKSKTEVLLSMLGKPGTPYTPIPLDPNEDLDEDFIKGLKNTIRIWEDETEQSAEHKEMVNWMKKAMADMQKEGWKVGDLLRELEKERKHQWEMLGKAQSIMSETEETMPEHATIVRETLNGELQQIGVDPLPKSEVEDEVQQKETLDSQGDKNE